MTKFKVELGGNLVEALKEGKATWTDNKLFIEFDADEYEIPDKDDAYETALGFVTDSSVLHVESDADDIEELA